MKRHALRRTRRGQAGFSLIELIVVVLIIGILGAIMIPGYTKSVEFSKADDAAGVVAMLGQANRMFRLDNNQYVANGGMIDGCNATACMAGSVDRCQLVGCNYLGSRQWDSLAYAYQVGSSVNCGIPGAPNGIACGKRTGVGAPFGNWGYVMNAQGIVSEYPPGPCPTCPPKPIK